MPMRPAPTTTAVSDCAGISSRTPKAGGGSTRSCRASILAAPRHFHLKVQRPGAEVLTTQLYFPGEPYNERDRIFNAALLLDITVTNDGRFGRYDFVVG